MNIQLSKPFIQIENLPNPPIRLGEQTFIPFAQVIKLVLPGGQVFFSWSRPSGVILQTASGSQTIIPVLDLTRMIQVAIVMICAGVGLIVYLLPSIINSKEQRHAE